MNDLKGLPQRLEFVGRNWIIPFRNSPSYRSFLWAQVWQSKFTSPVGFSLKVDEFQPTYLMIYPVYLFLSIISFSVASKDWPPSYELQVHFRAREYHDFLSVRKFPIEFNSQYFHGSILAFLMIQEDPRPISIFLRDREPPQLWQQRQWHHMLPRNLFRQRHDFPGKWNCFRSAQLGPMIMKEDDILMVREKRTYHLLPTGCIKSLQDSSFPSLISRSKSIHYYIISLSHPSTLLVSQAKNSS